MTDSSDDDETLPDDDDNDPTDNDEDWFPTCRLAGVLWSHECRTSPPHRHTPIVRGVSVCQVQVLGWWFVFGNDTFFIFLVFSFSFFSLYFFPTLRRSVLIQRVALLWLRFFGFLTLHIITTFFPFRTLIILIYPVDMWITFLMHFRALLSAFKCVKKSYPQASLY